MGRNENFITMLKYRLYFQDIRYPCHRIEVLPTTSESRPFQGFPLLDRNCGAAAASGSGLTNYNAIKLMPGSQCCECKSRHGRCLRSSLALSQQHGAFISSLESQESSSLESQEPCRPLGRARLYRAARRRLTDCSAHMRNREVFRDRHGREADHRRDPWPIRHRVNLLIRPAMA